MIAAVRGRIIGRDLRSVVVDVSGVGYRIFSTKRVLGRPDGEEVQLVTHLHFSGDTIELYGFASDDELGLFLSLLKVSGVGPRSALAILSEVPADQLRQSIIDAEPGLLVRVPGIGRKIAERIILELSGSIAKPAASDDEARLALERLGYTTREAGDALAHIPTTVTDVRERIRAALRSLSAKP